MIIGYTIRSTSPEGIYYLINGWYNYFGFWCRKKDIDENTAKHIHKVIFKTVGNAKTSLKKLLKIMPDYATDAFTLCEIHTGSEIIPIADYVP